MKTIVQLVTELKTYFLGKDTAAKQAVEANIAPVETDASAASQGYSVGAQLFLGDVLYDVTAPIAQNDALVVNTNIKAADKVSSDIEALANQVTGIYEVMGKNGAKNLTPFPYFNSSPHTTNGITFTVNSDGSVTASGTASSDAYFRCTYASGDEHIALLADTDYIINGTGNASAAVILRDSTNTKVASARATDATYSCTSAGNYDIVLLVDNGTDLTTPLTIYPMVRYASDSDSTYQPYAKTNQELTAENQTLTNKVGTVTSKTLAANATSVQFDVPTSGDYVIDFFSSDGSNYTAIDLSVSGKATLTFESVASSRTISCRVAQA
jgi:hypothetical protein